MQQRKSAGERIKEQREVLERRLEERGARRLQLMEELKTVEADIRVLMLDATEARITTRRMGELVGLTSGAVSTWIGKERQR
jgi:hypothetical protein